MLHSDFITILLNHYIIKNNFIDEHCHLPWIFAPVVHHFLLTQGQSFHLHYNNHYTWLLKQESAVTPENVFNVFRVLS